jgi:hypothetical protein
MRVLLTLALFAHSVDAQSCDAATQAAESTCKTTNACTTCSDFDFGDDCASNEREHCAEIECCPSCEAEITAMFGCEHGTSCPAEVPLTCDGCDEATRAAEVTCKSTNACTACSDFNYGCDVLRSFGLHFPGFSLVFLRSNWHFFLVDRYECADNKGEHCSEIECCPV